VKQYMNFSANDKMVEHTIFWNNIWNLTALVGYGAVILLLIWLFKDLAMFALLL